MFSAAGIGGGPTGMNSGFSSICSYPYLYYYYQYCMGMGGAGTGMPDLFPYVGMGGAGGPNNSPGFSGGNYPMFSPATNGVDIGGPNHPGFGPNSFNSPSYNGQFMNPYAWASSGVPDASAGGNPSGLLPFNQENSPMVPGQAINPQVGGNPGSQSPVIPVPNSPPFQRSGFGQRGSPMTIDNPVMGFIPPEYLRRNALYPPPGFHVFPMLPPPGLPTIFYAKMFGPLVEERPLVNNTGVPAQTDLNAGSESGYVPPIYLNPQSFLEKRRMHKILSKLTGKSASIQTVKDFEKYITFAMEVLGGAVPTGEQPPSNQSKPIEDIAQVKQDQQLIFEAVFNSSSTDQPKCVEKYFCAVTASLTAGNRTLALEVLQVIRPVAARLLDAKIPGAEWDMIAGMDLGRQSSDLCKQVNCRNA
ncbi:hypothetical protein BV898_07473 [Hypsibius exemplaris]|uniref:Uncharacterized protein n=1 Tax=Hypsibius exemplaris TaxID=2072580 RepID=A0A1W0WTE0_HYPEX|nr:hypothetical protein BV898_07473 [Hypsibius exemplaris]